MSNDILNTLVLSALLVAAVGFGFYTTQVRQPETLEEITQHEKALRMKQAEVAELLVMQAASAEQAELAVRRWNSRYKVLPVTLTSPEVVDYLNALSAYGFKNFDIVLSGIQRQPQVSAYTYKITGRAFYESLYRFIWNVENGRGMYRVRNLQLNPTIVMEQGALQNMERQLVMVNFEMSVDAYFAGFEGMSAADSLITVPEEALPPRRTANNPFYPGILTDVPPNSEDQIDVESDELVSIIGETAIFRRNGRTRSLKAGDAVYLGRIGSVDPQRARVRIEMNRGGIRERVELDLQSGDRFRQALGPVQLVPITGPAPDAAPPAPGTPEARREARQQARSPHTP
jgi:hypothetical protein